MSHFSVLVIGAHPDNQLAPFHEFECTGKDDEFVVDVDKTDELRKEYETRTEKRVRAPDGTVHSFFTEKGDWDIRFSKPDPENAVFKSLDRRVKFIPEGHEEIEVPTKDVMTFAQFIEDWSGLKSVPYTSAPNAEDHKYGYVLLDAKGDVIKAIDRTNPNAKWDWYQIGGRYTGKLKLKEGRPGRTGKPGLMTEPADPGFVDQAFKNAIDFKGMQDKGEAEHRARHKRFMELLGSNPMPRLWKDVRAANPGNIDAARDAYNSQSGLKAVREDRDFFWYDDVAEEFSCSEEEYAQRGRQRAIATYAVVKDGKWYQRGEMGWFGIAHDEKDESEWDAEVAKMLDALPGDTLLTLVDCHI